MAGYSRLPLNATDAALRLEELRNLMPSSKPRDFQQALSQYTEWLSDIADGHWKLHTAFSKHEATKAQADNEKQAAFKFGGLKRQAMLLQAEFLVAQRRYPEAVAPLIDIIVQEPRTDTGQQAYRLLQDIGFASELAEQPEKPANGTATSAKGGLPR